MTDTKEKILELFSKLNELEKAYIAMSVKNMLASKGGEAGGKEEEKAKA